MRVGIEIEYWVIDADGRLAPADGLTDLDGVDREFVEPLLEIKTPPCDTVADLAAALEERLASVLSAARRRGKRLVPLGTPLGDAELEIGDDDCSEIQRAVFGDRLRHATHCAGTHVHVEQTDAREQLRLLTAADPAFALLNTAPYYRDDRVGTCARPHAYRRLCYGDSPEFGRLWPYPDSAAAWRRRRDDCFERFRDAAVASGVDPDRVSSAFTPHDAVWSPVRLRDDLGTVEWRGPDSARPTDACRLVADLRGLLRRAVDRGTAIREGGGSVELPPFDRLRTVVDAAIDRGLDDPLVERHLATLGLSTESYRPFGIRIDGREGLDADTVRTLRLRAADALERDLESLRKHEPEASVPAVS